MVQRGQLVIGPAGSGKSTYCSVMAEHCQENHRVVRVVNLDPAAEYFPYEVALDIRDLISLEDVVDELNYGPNGGLVYCMEFLTQNLDWLRSSLNEFSDDEYFIFDCPGQIEFFTHFSMLKSIIHFLQNENMTLCCVFLMDALFIDDPCKFLSGSLVGMSSMLQLELPHVNVLSKCDLVKEDRYQNFLIPDSLSLYQKLEAVTDSRHRELNKRLCELLDEFGLVSFIPLNIKDDDSVDTILLQIDICTQFEDDQEVQVHEDLEREDTEIRLEE